MTEIYFYEDIESGDAEALLNGLPLSFSARVRKYRDPETKRASAIAYTLLFSALSRRATESAFCSETATPQTDLFALSENENGKPCFVNLPYHFSLSHSRNFSVCAISDAPCGVDTEAVQSDNSIDKPSQNDAYSEKPPRKMLKKTTDFAAIAHRFLSEKEAQEIATAASAPLAFAQCWTAHEAFAKESGTALCTTFKKSCHAPFSTLITASDGTLYALSCVGEGPFSLVGSTLPSYD